MRIAYLDCFAGISGDMLLGALLGAGVPADVLHSATAALGLGATLKIETVDRSGISAEKVHVLESGHLAESQPQRSAESARNHEHTHTHEHEAGGHHEHPHGRSLVEIRALIQSAPLHEAVKGLAVLTFDLLGQAEATIHNVPVEQIHFHEVGAVDAIVDIVAASAGIHHLQIGAWHSSTVNVGGGMVECAHGTFPVPAPATADLLRGFPTYSAHIQKELATPTGAALLRALNPTFGPQPAMRVEAIGYGAGTRNPKNFPNVLRLSIGERTEAAAIAQAHNEIVTVIETALDDLSPQLLAYVAEKALAAGALDVMLTPVIMKKGRPGTLLTVLCNPADSSIFEQMVFSETSTLGLRIRQDPRVCLERRHISVETVYGRIRMKIGTQNGEERNAAPEFEDCRTAAAQHDVPLKQVQQAAIAAYAGGAMNRSDLLELLAAVERGSVSADAAANRLATLPFEDLGHARVDHDRSLRAGLPEVIYAAGKTAEQTASIFDALVADGVDVLATRVDVATAQAVQGRHPQAIYNTTAHTLMLRQTALAAPQGNVAVLCAGTSDLPVAEEAAVTAETFGAHVNRLYDVGVAGLHRLLSVREQIAAAHVVIVCAGMEGALPSVVGGLVGVPVIAVPTSVGYGASFAGAAALLGMLNSCSPNVTVTNIDNGFGAAYTAVLIARASARQ